MIDPLSITIISKALDFVISEAHNLINEARKQKQPEDESPDDTQSAEEEQKYKDSFLKKEMNENFFEDQKNQLDHLLKKATIHQKNYHVLSEQCAQFSDLYVPPHIKNSRDEEKKKLVYTLFQIKDIIEKHFGEEIDIHGLDLLIKHEDI